MPSTRHAAIAIQPLGSLILAKTRATRGRRRTRRGTSPGLKKRSVPPRVTVIASKTVLGWAPIGKFHSRRFSLCLK